MSTKLSHENALYWRAAALQDLADVLAVQLLLSKDGAEVSTTTRLLARLVSEPDGAGLEPAEQLLAAKKRAQGALKVLNAPEPRKSDEAARLAAAAWERFGEASDMHWALALKPHELFEVHPFQVRLATDVGPYFEPRNVLDLDAGQLGSVRRCGVWSPIHVKIVEDPPGLLVIAGSRRTRMVRVLIREGLEILRSGGVPERPRPLLALVPAGSIESDIYLADNLLRTGENPWTIAERFAMQLEAGQGGESRLRAKDLAERSGVSTRLVTYYLSLARLPGRLRAEGLAGRLGIKLADFLAKIPDHEVQIRLFEVTLPLKSESDRIKAARILLEREGAELADGRELVLPDLASPSKISVFAPKLRAGLVAAASKAKGPAKKQVALVADFVAACEGDSEAASRLPAELREALPGAEPTQTQRRRHPSQARERREAKPETWPGFTYDEQRTWRLAGILSQSNAEAFRQIGVPADALCLHAQLAPDAPRVMIGKLYESFSVDFETAKKLLLEGLNNPAALDCPVCGAAQGFECCTDEANQPALPGDGPLITQDGWTVHAIRHQEVQNIREALQGGRHLVTVKPERKKRWPAFTPEDQAAWEAAGIHNDVSAQLFERFGITAATVAQMVMVGDVRASYGEHYTRRILSMDQIRARLRQLPLIDADETADPLEVVCPVCAAEVGDACDDGGHPHKIRTTLATKARGLRAVTLEGVA
jgi:transcriptional regulator with XRE-family HTH domain